MNQFIEPKTTIPMSCSNCAHQHLCKYTTEYSEVVEAVNNLELKSHNPHKEHGIPVKNISFIRPIGVECKFFSKTAATPR